MVKIWDDTTTVETCPVCDSLEVRVVEPDWFVLELGADLAQRADLVRRAEAGIEFHCRDCGWNWF